MFQTRRLCTGYLDNMIGNTSDRGWDIGELIELDWLLVAIKESVRFGLALTRVKPVW
jgi:hypothetical protein